MPLNPNDVTVRIKVEKLRGIEVVRHDLYFLGEGDANQLCTFRLVNDVSNCGIIQLHKMRLWAAAFRNNITRSDIFKYIWEEMLYDCPVACVPRCIEDPDEAKHIISMTWNEEGNEGYATARFFKWCEENHHGY